MAQARSTFIAPPGGLRSGQSVEIALPAGYTAAHFAGTGHKVIALGSIYSQTVHFALTISTSIVLTWASTATSLPGSARGELVLVLAPVGDIVPALVGDGSADDTARLQAAADDAYASNKRLMIPEARVAFMLTDTVTFREEITVEGQGFHSFFRWSGGASKPIFAQHKWQSPDEAGARYITMRKVRIDDWSLTPTRSVRSLHFANGDYHVFEDIQYEGRFVGTPANPYGLIVGKDPAGTFSGNTWVPRIERCSFQRASVIVNTTDGFVLNSELYGKGRDFALQIGGGNIISGCNFIGGNTNGAIYLYSPEGDTIYAVKVLGCQFDGTANDDTSYAIYSPVGQTVQSCTFGRNHAWNHTREFVRLETAIACIVTDWDFRQGDAADLGYADVYVKGYGNRVDDNTHFRANTAPKKTGGSTVRVNLGVPVTVVNDGGVNAPIRGSIATSESNDYATHSFGHAPSVNAAAVDEFLDDFNGRALDTTQWGTVDGTDVGAGVSVANGDAVLTLGTTSPATLADNGAQLDRALAFRADSGGTFFEVKVRLSAEGGIAVFCGLTDQVGALEIPFTLSGTTIVSNATDAVGFLHDSAADTDNWHCLGVKANVDTALLTSAVTPARGTDYVLRVELTVGGRARFFIDGAYIGELADAVTATAWLTPVLVAFSRNTTAKTVRAAYLWAGQNRR